MEEPGHLEVINVQKSQGELTVATEDEGSVAAEDEQVEAVSEEIAEISLADSEESVTETIEKEEPVEEEEEEEEIIDFVSFVVRTPAGKSYPLNKVQFSTTLFEVKQMVAKMDGSMKPEEMKFILAAKPMKDNRMTIGEYNIPENASVFCVKQLFSAEDKDPGFAGPKHEKTEEKDRGIIKITIPQGATPGTQLIIQPPGRPQMRIQVPRGYTAGMQLRVKLPDEQQEERPRYQQSSQPTQQQQQQRRVPPAAGGSTLMKVKCPANARPGDEIKIAVNGKQMKVQVPANTVPGAYFYFRVMNSY